MLWEKKKTSPPLRHVLEKNMKKQEKIKLCDDQLTTVWWTKIKLITVFQNTILCAKIVNCSRKCSILCALFFQILNQNIYMFFYKKLTHFFSRIKMLEKRCLFYKKLTLYSKLSFWWNKYNVICMYNSRNDIS